jgi:hypothetical protein
MSYNFNAFTSSPPTLRIVIPAQAGIQVQIPVTLKFVQGRKLHDAETSSA